MVVMVMTMMVRGRVCTLLCFLNLGSNWSRSGSVTLISIAFLRFEDLCLAELSRASMTVSSPTVLRRLRKATKKDY